MKISYYFKQYKKPLESLELKVFVSFGTKMTTIYHRMYNIG